MSVFRSEAPLRNQDQNENRVKMGLWLRLTREAVGLSQRDLAEKIGVSYYTFISQIESGKGKIPSERYKLWAKALNIPPKQFAMEMLRVYEPSVYDLIFEGDGALQNSGECATS